MSNRRTEPNSVNYEQTSFIMRKLVLIKYIERKAGINMFSKQIVQNHTCVHIQKIKNKIVCQ